MIKYEYAYVEVGEDDSLIDALNAAGADGWKVSSRPQIYNAENEKWRYLMLRPTQVEVLSSSQEPVRISAEDNRPDPWKLRPSERSLSTLAKEVDGMQWVFTLQAVEEILKKRMGR